MGQQRTERKRAEKAANRAAKAAKKEVHVVEDKKRRMGNGLLALLIFGVVALMFAVTWGYNYSQKEASLESYIANHGGEAEYSNIMLSEEQTMSVTAEKNNMKIVLDVNCPGGGDEDVEYYKSDEGVDWMKYVGAYYLATMKPVCRGVSANAAVVVNVNGEEATSVDVSWSDVEDILDKNGTSVESIRNQVAEHEAEHEHEHEAEETTEEAAE